MGIPGQSKNNLIHFFRLIFLVSTLFLAYGACVHAGVGQCVCTSNCGNVPSINASSPGQCFPYFTEAYNNTFGTDCTHSPELIDSNHNPNENFTWDTYGMHNVGGSHVICQNPGGGMVQFRYCSNNTQNYPECETNQVSLPSTLGGKQPSCPRGNPVHPATGNKFQTETDFANTGELSFTRYYNSLGEEEYGLGKGWSAQYHQHLLISSSILIVLNNQDGQSHAFNCSSIGECEKLADIKDLLEKTATGFLLTTEDNVVESYDLNGKLISITSLSGQTQTLSYNSTTDLLETVTDNNGRIISFTYDTQERPATITDPDGEVYTYDYDTNNNLVKVTYPDNTPGTNTDNPTRQYQYNDTNYPNHLTDIIDENGNTFASFGYDTQGRAIFTEHANGNERIDLTYNADGTTTVTDSLGATNTYTYEIMFGVPRTSTITGGQCGSGCTGEGQAQTYDANGFLASRTDFEGNITTFINNSRGLQTSRTEAVSTPEERTITTEWHSDFRLPTKITEPGKETIFTYDTQGRLLSRAEREI